MWNARNQLTALSGSVSASFQYDAVGRRRLRTVGGNAKQYLYDGLNPMQELASGTPVANLLTGVEIDEYFTRTDGSGVWNYLADAQGSSVGLADGLGAVETEYTYEPFGTVTTSGASTGNTLAFTGREADGTELYFYRSRYYMPTRQRFLNEDSLGLEGGANLYAYVENSPANYVDPLGLQATLLGSSGWTPRMGPFLRGRRILRPVLGGNIRVPRRPVEGDNPYRRTHPRLQRTPKDLQEPFKEATYPAGEAPQKVAEG